jgi:hypothetical protein
VPVAITQSVTSVCRSSLGAEASNRRNDDFGRLRGSGITNPRRTSTRQIVACDGTTLQTATAKVPLDGGRPVVHAELGGRLVVRRTRLTGHAQQRLWPDWRHHAFLTDLTGPVVDIDKFHRHHAVVELAIRDLKEGAGLEHVPSGNFHANSVWLQCAVLAHNLIRWTTILGNTRVADQLIVSRTIRTRFLTIPGRIVNRAGRPTLRLPTHWPWATAFTTALNTLRTLQPSTG